MTVSLGTAYRSFDGEVDASNTPTICRLHRFMPSPTFGHSSPAVRNLQCLNSPSVVREYSNRWSTKWTRQRWLRPRPRGRQHVIRTVIHPVQFRCRKYHVVQSYDLLAADLTVRRDPTSMPPNHLSTILAVAVHSG